MHHPETKGVVHRIISASLCRWEPWQGTLRQSKEGVRAYQRSWPTLRAAYWAAWLADVNAPNSPGARYAGRVGCATPRPAPVTLSVSQMDPSSGCSFINEGQCDVSLFKLTQLHWELSLLWWFIQLLDSVYGWVSPCLRYRGMGGGEWEGGLMIIPHLHLEHVILCNGWPFSLVHEQ